mmetsp:Transcript_95592/g.270477  ORF Transcript_95592/g.270477 Transcript_95592/m.270477 type:complete len:754 (-) Transcript_95592:70-2331(-)
MMHGGTSGRSRASDGGGSEWSCKRCGNPNSTRLEVCFQCGASRWQDSQGGASGRDGWRGQPASGRPGAPGKGLSFVPGRDNADKGGHIYRPSGGVGMGGGGAGGGVGGACSGEWNSGGWNSSGWNTFNSGGYGGGGSTWSSGGGGGGWSSGDWSNGKAGACGGSGGGEEISSGQSRNWNRNAEDANWRRGHDSGGGCGKGGGCGRGTRIEEDTSNDWDCGACSTRNFARRSECFKCGAPRRDRSRSASRGRERGRGGGGKGKGLSFVPGRDSVDGGADRSGGKGSRGGGKGGKDDGGKPSGSGQDSRALYQASGSQSSSSRSRSSSSDKSQKQQRKGGRPGLWDSTEKVAEPRHKGAAKKKKRKRLELEVGAKVDLHGLVGAAQYNGCQGRVVAGPNAKDRWDVELEFQQEPKTLSLLAANLQPKPTCGWEVIAAGLTSIADEQDVERAFQQAGQVRKVKVTRDIDGVSKGVALVEMCNREGAEKALEMLDETRVRGWPIKVQWSTMVKQEMGLLKTRGEGSDDSDDDGGEPAEPRRKFREKNAGGFDNLSSGTTKAPPFSMGQELVVTGLKGAAHYNGMTVRMEGVNADGRCEVLLMQPGGVAKSIAVKVENLVPADSKPSGPADSAARGDAGGRDNGCCENGGADAAKAAKDDGGDDGKQRRSRRSWGAENEGGIVYTGEAKKSDAPEAAPTSAAAPGRSGEPLPTAAELKRLSAKELKQLLTKHNVDLTACIDKDTLLERALSLASPLES